MFDNWLLGDYIMKGLPLVVAFYFVVIWPFVFQFKHGWLDIDNDSRYNGFGWYANGLVGMVCILVVTGLVISAGYLIGWFLISIWNFLYTWLNSF